MDDNDKKNEDKLIIEGVDSKTGKKFRPGDWAERMSESLSTFRNRRIIYSPSLRPAINKFLEAPVKQQLPCWARVLDCESKLQDDLEKAGCV